MYGNIEWEQIIDVTFSGDVDWGVSAQQTNDGGYILTVSNGVCKINENGETEWILECGDVNSIRQINDGSYVTTVALDNDIHQMIKINENGEEEWSQDINMTNVELVQQTIDNGYIIVGSIFTDINNKQIHLMKTNESGEEKWNKFYGGIGFDSGKWVEQTNDGGYIICGRFANQPYTSVPDPDATYDLWLIKTDSEGNITSTNIIETSTVNKYLIKTIDILGRETNNNEGFQLEIYDDGSVEVKYLIK